MPPASARRPVCTRVSVNPLGVPETEADWQFVTETITRRSPVPPPVGDDFERLHVAFLNGLAKDMQLIEAPGRWLFSRPPNRQPAEYVPGDVLALRAKAVMDYVISFPDSKRPAFASTRLPWGHC